MRPCLRYRRSPLFIAASLVLLVIPGPAVLFIVARSGAQGRRAGLVSVLGVHTASIVHVLAAVAGVSAIVVASSMAFTAVKVVGGCYLIYLGIKSTALRREQLDSEVAEAAGRRSNCLPRDSSSACSIRRSPCSSWRSCHSSSTGRMARSGRRRWSSVCCTSRWVCAPTACMRSSGLVSALTSVATRHVFAPPVTRRAASSIGLGVLSLALPHRRASRA